MRCCAVQCITKLINACNKSGNYILMYDIGSWKCMFSPVTIEHFLSRPIFVNLDLYTKLPNLPERSPGCQQYRAVILSLQSITMSQVPGHQKQPCSCWIDGGESMKCTYGATWISRHNNETKYVWKESRGSKPFRFLHCNDSLREG